MKLKIFIERKRWEDKVTNFNVRDRRSYLFRAHINRKLTRRGYIYEIENSSNKFS